MLSNRTLQLTFLISFVTHVVVITQNPGYIFFTPKLKSQKIEINYIKTPQVGKREFKRSNSPKGESFLKLPSRITMNKVAPPPFIERDVISKANMQAMRKEIPFERPALIKPDIIAIRKKITLPPVDMGKIGNPSYISYYQVVREKIRRAAYQNYNRSETGEVYITFIISSVGYLSDVRLVEEKTSAPAYLKDIALVSVKNASPFPTFPKELDYSQLSFSVVISFEVE
jgi:hypothetical protein